MTTTTTSHHCHNSNEGQGRGQLGLKIQHVLSLWYFFFLFQIFTSFFFTKCLSFKRSMNGHYHHHQWNECGLEMHLHLEFRYVTFFCPFFVLNIYLQWDYMYRMATRTMHGGLEVGITMNGGRRAWDASWSILSLKYVSFFFTKCLSFKRSTDGHYHHHQWNECGLETQMLLEFWYVTFFCLFFVLNIYLQLDYMNRMATRTMHRGLEVGITTNGGRRAWDTLWSVSSLKYIFFFLISFYLLH